MRKPSSTAVMSNNFWQKEKKRAKRKLLKPQPVHARVNSEATSKIYGTLLAVLRIENRTFRDFKRPKLNASLEQNFTVQFAQ